MLVWKVARNRHPNGTELTLQLEKAKYQTRSLTSTPVMDSRISGICDRHFSLCPSSSIVITWLAFMWIWERLSLTTFDSAIEYFTLSAFIFNLNNRIRCVSNFKTEKLAGKLKISCSAYPRKNGSWYVSLLYIHKFLLMSSFQFLKQLLELFPESIRLKKGRIKAQTLLWLSSNSA